MTMVIWPHRSANLTISPGADDMPAASATVASPAQRTAMAAAAAVRIVTTGFSGATAAPTKAAGLRFVFAGGGTGGHIYPGLAVAEALEQATKEPVEIIWAATARPVDQRLLKGMGRRYVAQSVQPIPRNIKKAWPFVQAWRESCQYWERAFRETAPHVVLALGGYAAAPAAFVAAKMGIPVALINPDAVPGIANRQLLRRAAQTFTQWELPANLEKKLRGKSSALGCPIRPSILDRTREDAILRLALQPHYSTLVITGASLGAQTINDAMVQLLADAEIQKALAGNAVAGQRPWQILHLAGQAHGQALEQAYAALNVKFPFRVMAYCDDMASVWAAADLTIARAGASTCAELTACGVPAILMPYPYHRDQHQRHNAQELVNAHAAVLVKDTRQASANAAALKEELIPLLSQPGTRKAMSAAARREGKPNAARDIARELLTMARPA